MEEKNRILKRLEEKKKAKQAKYANREQGFNTMFSGANQERVRSQQARARTKQAPSQTRRRSSTSKDTVAKDIQSGPHESTATGDQGSSKTRPRKNWARNTVEIRGDNGLRVKLKPVTFASRRYTAFECTYSTTESIFRFTLTDE